jgi:hypothetical protein
MQPHSNPNADPRNSPLGMDFEHDGDWHHGNPGGKPDFLCGSLNGRKWPLFRSAYILFTHWLHEWETADVKEADGRFIKTSSKITWWLDTSIKEE